MSSMSIYKLPYLFIHLPKTAGSSFRVAAERFFGKSAVLRDYGSDSDATSDLIKRHVYGKLDDQFALQRYIHEDRYKMITGHVTLEKFLWLSTIEQAIVFYRHPVQQVISYYLHQQQVYGNTESFESFFMGRGINNQSNQLSNNIPIEMVGFNLITEQYKLSIDLFNAETGLDLEVLSIGLNPNKTGLFYTLSEDDEKIILERSPKDWHLYNKAVKLFNARRTLLNNSKVGWTYGCVNLVEDGQLTGWAYQRNLSPVELEVLVDGKVVAEPIAKDKYIHKNIMLPRKGFIGYCFKFNRKPFAGKIIQCRVKSSGQLIGEQQL